VDVDTGYDTADIQNADLVILIGSDGWMTFEDAPLTARLKARVEAGGRTAAICAATLALAQTGALDARPHTSNSEPFLSENVPIYQGKTTYRDVAHAVSDGVVVTAPGSAPASFAVACAALLDPARQAEVVGYWNMVRGEFEALGTELAPIWKS
jgi:putative intracellular protease/amidase